MTSESHTFVRRLVNFAVQRFPPYCRTSPEPGLKIETLVRGNIHYCRGKIAAQSVAGCKPELFRSALHMLGYPATNFDNARFQNSNTADCTFMKKRRSASPEF